MPKRVIDFDAMWGSDKLAACAAWAQGEYAWLYGLADASGCFELTNLRVIWGRVAAIRGNLTIERLEQVFAEFQDKGLLFVWEHEGKRYAHWTGSDVPGRLPPPSWRMRLEKFAPPVPKQQLAEYMARFARGRAALGGVGFRAEAREESGAASENLKFENSNLREVRVAAGGRDVPARESRNAGGWSGIKEDLEGTQAQDWGLNWNLNGNGEVGWEEGRGGPGDARGCRADANRGDDSNRTDSCKSKSNASANSHLSENSRSEPSANSPSYANANSGLQASGPRFLHVNPNSLSEKELAVWRELRVGQGPVCGPAGVRPEVIERDRRRQAARAGTRGRSG
jgi:hypothetical protein